MDYGDAMRSATSLPTWLHEFELRRAQTVIDVPGGAAVLNGDFPASYDHNKLSIVEPTPASELVAAADAVLGGAGHRHRLIELRTPAAYDALPDGLGPGYARDEDVVMTLTGATPAPPAIAVERLSLDERSRSATQTWREELPDAGSHVWQQLGERIRTVVDAAQTTFFGVRDETGRVAARGDLYIHAGVAQIEDVHAAPVARRRGYATAIVLEAVSQARTAGADLIFLVADVDGPARRLYERLGFTATHVIGSFAAQVETS